MPHPASNILFDVMKEIIDPSYHSEGILSRDGARVELLV
jgi:hypothetical protein